MPLDDRFDDLVASLGGFHRTWLVYLGIELGLFEQIRAAGAAGLTPDELAERTGLRAARDRGLVVGGRRARPRRRSRTTA